MNNSQDCEMGTGFTDEQFVIQNLDFFEIPMLVFSCTLSVVSLFAVFANSLVIIAIYRTPNLQTKPSYLLICNMAFIDLFASVVYYPIVTAKVISFNFVEETFACSFSKIKDFIGLYVFSMSFVMSLIISLDRYFAIVLKHRYKEVVTKKRILSLTLFMSIKTFVFIALVFHVDTISPYWRLITVAFGIAILLLATVLYVKSFKALYRYTAQVNPPKLSNSSSQPLQNNANSFNAIKYKKSLKTMLVVLLWLLVCFFPLLISQYFLLYAGVGKVSITLLYFCFLLFSTDSLTNPIIYIVRFTDIRAASITTIRGFIAWWIR